MIIDGIEYDFEKAIRSQKFIRHLHINVALRLSDTVGIKPENIHLEVRLKNKNIDIGVIEENQLKFAISIRSQSSSIKKNFTNNVDGLQGEVVKLKNSYPDLNAGVVYLLKRIDIKNNEDCMEYYLNKIPKKLIPIISGTSLRTKDRYDTGCIIIWDIDESGNVYFEKDKYIIDNFSIENFIRDIKELYGETKIKSQFTLSELDEEKFTDFLSSN